MNRLLFSYIALILIAAVPFAFGSRYIFHIATMVTIMAPMASGLGLMIKLGQLSVAQPAFMGIGAYTAALLSMRIGLPTSLSLLLGGLLAAIIALLCGRVFLRIKGVYFVLLTYAFGQIVVLIFQEWTSVFGGMSGLYGIPKLSVFGFRLVRPEQYFVVGLFFTAASYCILRLIERSNVGAIIDALNEDETLATSMGSNAILWRTAAFTLSALMAGLSGGLYALYIGFLSPDPFGFRGSVDLIVINTIGGVGSLLGPLLGSILIVPLPEVLRNAREFQLMVYGGILIAFLLFAKHGLVSFISGTRRTAR